jgi:hypothetical protein
MLMKKTVFGKIWLLLPSIMLIINGLTNIASGQEFKNALAYLDYMSNQYRQITDDMWNYTSAVAHGKNARKIENRRQELIKTTLKIQQNIAKMPAFENDASLRDSSVAYLKMSYSVLNFDYSKIVDMEAVAEQSYDMMEAYLLAQDKANEKMDLSGKMLENEEKVFAQKHNIKLLEGKDKITNNLEKAKKAFGYYNVIYLIFFRNYKQDIYLSEALRKNDINAIEQNKTSLLRFSLEGLKKLDSIKGFNGDNSLKLSCRQVLDFYKSEASDKIPILVSYFFKKENFDKIKTAFDAKSQTERTKADVDQYNKTLGEYNKAIADYNRVNQEISNKLNSCLDLWNKSVETFLDRHVPKR